MSRQSVPFNPDDVIKMAQTSIICALLRLLKDDNPVVIRKVFGDLYLIESVRLVNNYHNVEVTVRFVEPAATLDSNDEIDTDNPENFDKNPFSVRLKERPYADSLNMLSFLYKETEKALRNAT